MYQHEIPSLQALSQQLGHLDLNTTKVYVTDPANREDSERISRKIAISAKSLRNVHLNHVKGITEQIDVVRDEKLIEIVLSILGGSPSSGGYSSYVRRFYRMVSQHVDMSALDRQQQATLISKSLRERGHTPNPSRHGECMSGSQHPTPSAKCRGENTETRRHLRSAQTCAKCPFHHFNSNYLTNLREDLERLRLLSDDPFSTSFERARARIEAENLAIVISHHDTRLKEP